MLEEDTARSADGGDVNRALSDEKFKKAAGEYAAENSWLDALAFARAIVVKCREMAETVAQREPGENTDEAVRSMFSAAEDIKHGMFALAKDGKLPKEGYRG